MHEAVVVDDDPATLSEAIAHERDTCHAPRFVIDLTALEHLDGEHVAILSREMSDHPEDEWAVRLSEAAAGGADDLTDSTRITVILVDASV